MGIHATTLTGSAGLEEPSIQQAATDYAERVVTNAGFTCDLKRVVQADDGDYRVLLGIEGMPQLSMEGVGQRQHRIPLAQDASLGTEGSEFWFVVPRDVACSFLNIDSAQEQHSLYAFELELGQRRAQLARQAESLDAAWDPIMRTMLALPDRCIVTRNLELDTDESIGFVATTHALENSIIYGLLLDNPSVSGLARDDLKCHFRIARSELM